MKKNDAMVPLLAIAAIFALAHQWPQALWSWIYTRVQVNDPTFGQPNSPGVSSFTLPAGSQVGTTGPGAAGLTVPGGQGFTLPPGSQIGAILSKIFGSGTAGLTVPGAQGSALPPGSQIGTTGGGMAGLQVP